MFMKFTKEKIKTKLSKSHKIYTLYKSNVFQAWLVRFSFPDIYDEVVEAVIRSTQELSVKNGRLIL